MSVTVRFQDELLPYTMHLAQSSQSQVITVQPQPQQATEPVESEIFELPDGRKAISYTFSYKILNSDSLRIFLDAASIEQGFVRFGSGTFINQAVASVPKFNTSFGNLKEISYSVSYSGFVEAPGTPLGEPFVIRSNFDIGTSPYTARFPQIAVDGIRDFYGFDVVVGGQLYSFSRSTLRLDVPAGRTNFSDVIASGGKLVAVQVAENSESFFISGSFPGGLNRFFSNLDGDRFQLFLNSETTFFSVLSPNSVRTIEVSDFDFTANVTLTYIFEPGLPDIAPLSLALGSGGGFLVEDIGGVRSGVGSGNVTIGRTDGDSSLLFAIGADVKFDSDQAVVNDADFFLINDTKAVPFFSGDVTFAVNTALDSVTGAISATDSPAKLTLAGYELTSRSFVLRENSVVFGSEINLPTGLATVTLQDDELIVFDNFGFRLDGEFGRKFLAEDAIIPFAIGPDRPIPFNTLSIEYDAVQDAFLGKGQAAFSVKGLNVVADLSGDNDFIKWQNGKDWELSGALRVEEKILLGGGWGFEEIELRINTETNELEASATLSVPWGRGISDAEATLKAGFRYEPKLVWDSAEFSIDKLNIPFISGFFIQGGSIGVSNLASEEEPAIISLSLAATLGRSIQVDVSDGEIGAELARVTGTLTTTTDASVFTGKLETKYLPVEASFKGVTLFEGAIGTKVGEVVWNTVTGAKEFTGRVSWLGGVIETEAVVRYSPNYNFVIFGSQQIAIPDTIARFIPGFGGLRGVNAGYDYLINFTNDDNLSNDSVAFWTGVTLPADSIFTAFFGDRTLDFGLKVQFNGDVSFVGGLSLPEAASATQRLTGNPFESAQNLAPPSGSVLEGDVDYLILTANWDNADPTAELVVNLPDGTRVTESNFADFGIEVIAQLSSEFSRTAIAVNPDAGTWSINVVSAINLGVVTTTILASNAQGDLSFTSLGWDARLSELSITFDANDADSDANVSFYLTTNPDDPGLFIGSAVEADGTATFKSSADGILPGDYFVYAILDDGTNAPLRFLSAQSVTITDIDPFVTITSDGGEDTAQLSPLEGQSSVTDIDADSLDPDLITYAIVGGADASRFTIDPATGRLSFVSAPDFETPNDNDSDNVYEVIVRAGDGSLSDTQTLNVSVADRSVAPRLITPGGFAGGIGGTTAVFLTSGFQDISILDAPGTITLSGSPGGDDILRFAGAASAYTITRVGSRVEIADGDTRVSIPVSPTGINVVFADGPRTLGIVGGQVRLGSQVANNTPAAIIAPAETDPLPNLADPAVRGRLIVAEGSPVTVAGKVDVFGTSFDNELFVAAGGDVAIRGGFTGGMDTVGFEGPASDYTAVRSGSTVFIETNGTRVAIPISPTGTKLLFGSEERLLKVDTATGKILIGTQEIGASPTPLTSNLQTSSIDSSDVTVSISPNGGDLMALAPSSFGEMLAFASAGSSTGPQSLIDMAESGSLASTEADLQRLLSDVSGFDPMGTADMLRMYYATAYSGMYAQAYLALDDDALMGIHQSGNQFGGLAPSPVMLASFDTFAPGG